MSYPQWSSPEALDYPRQTVMENSVLGSRGHAKKCICVNPGKVSSAFQQQTVLEMLSLRGFHARPN